MRYESAWNELLSSVPKLDALNAQKLVNRAWSNIQHMRRWTFLKRETAIIAPDAISTGSVTVTQNSITVAADAAAAIAITAVGADITTRQFRVGLGPIYNISAFVSPNLTLDRVYGETTAAGSVYSIFRNYITAPADFLRWESVIDPIFAYSFSLDWTKEEIDRVDPQRGAVNFPFRLAAYRYIPATPTIAEQYKFEMGPG